MRMTDILLKKREGKALTREEIRFFINGYVKGDIPDYQAAAWLMAAFLKGLSAEETSFLTEAMTDSGEKAELSGLSGVVADKHSTGGVADTTTLVAAPVAAACGVKMAKMSGRGLGHTGGTIDKLESIPGFDAALSLRDFAAQVERVGIAVTGQTLDLCPADKMLYALRDVTATVDDRSLIASSIMSKKLAAGASAIVLDVKTGSGAFMKTYEDSLRLAREMVRIGAAAGRRMSALITDMNQPLGRAVGNALEVKEAAEILQGGRPGDLKTLSLRLAGEILYCAGLAQDDREGVRMAGQALDDGRALRKFTEMVRAQKGDVSYIENPCRLVRARIVREMPCGRDGFVCGMDTGRIGAAAAALGAGRRVKDDVIDPEVGFWFHRRLGERVRKNDPLCTVYANSEEKFKEAMDMLHGSVTIGGGPCATPKLIYARVTEQGVEEY